jgi:hypothetical protein
MSTVEGGSMRASDETTATASPRAERAQDALDRISTALRGLRYGTVTAVVQDGVVVQVERMEKIRLDRRDAREAGKG